MAPGATTGAATPATVRPGEKLDLAIDVTSPRPGDAVVFRVTAAGGTDVVATLPPASVTGNMAQKSWTVAPGARPLPLAVEITAQLRGETIKVGQTIVSLVPSRLSTLGWLTANDEVLETDLFEGVRVVGPGDTLQLKFDLDDGAGGPLVETVAFTFILQRRALGATGAFQEVGRFPATATGIAHFQRQFTAPNDASVPGDFRVVVEARRAGETGPTPSLGARTSPVVRVRHFAPVVLSFQIDEASRVGAHPASVVVLRPGQQAQLFWTIGGKFDEVKLQPQNRDVFPFMSIDPSAQSNSGVLVVDPFVDGMSYTLTASFKGLPAVAHTVEVVALIDFTVSMQETQPPGKPRSLTKTNGKTPTPEVHGVPPKVDPGKPGDFSQFGRHKVLGQVSPVSNVLFAWALIGADKVRVELFAGPAAFDLDDKVAVGRRDVTAETRKNGGHAGLPVHDRSPTAVLDGELVIYEDRGGFNGEVLARSLIRLRENFPPPKLVAFHAVDLGPPPGLDPAEVEWDKLRFRWQVGGKANNNRLLLTLSQGGVARPPQTLKARGDELKGADTAPDGEPLLGLVVAEVRLVNDADDVQGKKIVTFTVVEPPPPPQPPPPAGDPPKMEVGFNYPVAGNRFGYQFGPSILPVEKGKKEPFWRDTLPANLDIVFDLGMKIVRWFVMGNAENYGDAPRKVVFESHDPDIPDQEMWDFDPPPALDPLFIAHWREFLQIFKDKFEKQGRLMRVIPSLVSFEMFGPRGVGGCSGRTQVCTDPTKREHFLDTVLQPFLDASKDFKTQIFAWEVINEPYWNSAVIAPPIGRHPPLGGIPDLPVSDMRAFIQGALDRIHAAGFSSTVGHRFLGDLDDYPAGTKPQFHYYHQVFGPFADQAEFPEFIETPGAFVGEIGTRLTGEFKTDHGKPWKEDCKGADETAKEIVFQRLRIMAQRGYNLALVWPDDDDKPPDVVKLTSDKRDSLLKFTKGRFPGGVPA
jgi:hypothetical protein